MNENPLEKAVTLALHYTDRAKALKGKRAGRAIRVLDIELYWYTKAAVELNNIYLDCNDPNTAYMYPIERQKAIADRYAFQVECMIYRLQQIMEGNAPTWTGYKEQTYILNALQKCSGLFLPLAVPNISDAIPEPPAPPADRHVHSGCLLIFCLPAAALLTFLLSRL